MKTMRLLAAFCLIGMTMAIAIATDETIELGSARISMDLSRLGSYSIEKGDLSSMDHKKPDFQYEITPARINVEGTRDQVQLEVHQMSMSEPLESSISNKDSANGMEHCIERSSLVPVGEDIQTEPFTIRPNVPYIKVSSDTNSSTGGTDGTSRGYGSGLQRSLGEKCSAKVIPYT